MGIVISNCVPLKDYNFQENLNTNIQKLYRDFFFPQYDSELE